MRVLRCAFGFGGLLLAMLALSGCGASGPNFSPGLTKPERGRALLYVYRPDTLIGIGNADVPFLHLDGRRLTRIRIGGHFAVAAAPGRHKLTTTESLLGRDTGKVRGETTFAVSAGSTAYLRYTELYKSIVPIVLPGVVIVHMEGGAAFESVAEAEALAELAKTRLLEPE
jgi:hypothetical protein